MKRKLSVLLIATALSLFAQSAAAQAQLYITVEFPDFRGPTEPPYLALWYSDSVGKTPLLVQRDKVKWLKDLKTFWRHLGRYQRQQADAVTSATRRTHSQNYTFSVPEHQGPLTLWLEVARENGQRELLKAPVDGDSRCLAGEKEIHQWCIRYTDADDEV